MRVDLSLHFFSVIVFSFCGLLLSFFIIFKHGFSALGFFNFFLILKIIVSNFSCFGLNLSVLSYLSRARNSKLRSSLALTGIVYTSIFVSVIICCLSVTSRQIEGLIAIESFSRSLPLVLPAILFFAINKIFFSALNASQSMAILAMGYMLRGIGYLSVVFFLDRINEPPIHFVLALTISETLVFLVFGIFYFKEYPSLQIRHLKIVTKMHLGFIQKAWLNSSLLDINPKIDMFFIAVFGSQYALGLYSFCSTIIEGLNQFFVLIQTNVNSPLAKRIRNHELETIGQVFYKNGKYLTILAILSAALALLAIFCLERYFVDLRFYPQGYQILFILSVGYVISSRYVPIMMIFNQTQNPHYYRDQLIFIAVTNLLLNSVLVPSFGAVGAAVATSISSIFGILFLKFQIKKFLGLSV